MDYKIVPLALTHPDWKTFIKVCQEHLGYSPTRGLDDQDMKPKDPASFLACLTMDNKPLENLRHGGTTNYTFHHVMFSFLAILDKKAVDALYYNIDLEIHCKANEDGEYITINIRVEILSILYFGRMESPSGEAAPQKHPEQENL